MPSLEEIRSVAVMEGWRLVDRQTRRQGRVVHLDPAPFRSNFQTAEAVYATVAMHAAAGSKIHRAALRHVRDGCPEEWSGFARAFSLTECEKPSGARTHRTARMSRSSCRSRR